MPATLGLDLGGTKIAAGVLAGRRLLNFLERPTPKSGAEAVIQALAELAREAMAGREVAAVGVGTPGPVDFARGVVRFAPNIPGMENVPLKAELERLLGLPVAVENDANAAALAEHRLGAAKGARHSLYLTVSTGIGGGAVANGRLLRGAFGQGGEVGHLVVDPMGPYCGCGNRGCLEAVASGRALRRDAEYVFGRPVAVPELVASKDPRAQALVAASAEWVGAALASLQRVLDPEAIVLGGGVALGGGRRYLAAVRRAYRARMQNFREARIALARLGRRAGVLGAALVALEVAGVADGAGPPLGEDRPA